MSKSVSNKGSGKRSYGICPECGRKKVAPELSSGKWVIPRKKKCNTCADKE